MLLSDNGCAMRPFSKAFADLLMAELRKNQTPEAEDAGLRVSTGLRSIGGSRESFPAGASSRRGKKEGKSLKCFSTSRFLENPSRVAAAGNRPRCLRKQGSGWEGPATQPAPTPACQDIAVPGLLAVAPGRPRRMRSSSQLCLAQQPPHAEGPTITVTQSRALATCSLHFSPPTPPMLTCWPKGPRKYQQALRDPARPRSQAPRAEPGRALAPQPPRGCESICVGQATGNGVHWERRGGRGDMEGELWGSPEGGHGQHGPTAPRSSIATCPHLFWPPVFGGGNAKEAPGPASPPPPTQASSATPR